MAAAWSPILPLVDGRQDLDPRQAREGVDLMPPQAGIAGRAGQQHQRRPARRVRAGVSQ